MEIKDLLPEQLRVFEGYLVYPSVMGKDSEVKEFVKLGVFDEPPPRLRALCAGISRLFIPLEFEAMLEKHGLSMDKPYQRIMKGTKHVGYYCPPLKEKELTGELREKYGQQNLHLMEHDLPQLPDTIVYVDDGYGFDEDHSERAGW